MANQSSLPAPGAVGMFRKSGNMVRVRQVCTERCYAGLLEVERICGGKAMLISPAAFIPEAELVDDDQSNELITR